MAEILTLTNPVAAPSTETWTVDEFTMRRVPPGIKTTFISNTGERLVWRFIPDETTTLSEVNTAISFVNQGKFKTVASKSLEKFLLQEAQSRGILPTGSVSGSES